ncbi:MAG: hypothetical protein IAE77_04385 [Prosthecobacter sp.]|jgi:hypothetical protein|uniref:hypothetical protein n=1 Tax=Prosthecobacter sp. TaxID=1965333 RepID=UPI0019EDE9E1|nr:hypothetical protein [Prosthecobacter sp.]MBE2282682.1 hypothetical protein [Prosthecobacter sp.]
MKYIRIVLFAIGSAIVYGIIHDQITTRVCIEYFTVAHPRLILSESPTVLGLFWGVVATWWVGLGLGLPLALASRVGQGPKLEWRDHRRGMGWLLGFMAALAAVAGVCAWLATRTQDPVHLADLTGQQITPHLRSRFLAAWAAHGTSYGGGFVGGLALIVLTIVRRRRMRRAPSASADQRT